MTFDIAFCTRNKSDIPSFDRISQLLSVDKSQASTTQKVGTFFQLDKPVTTEVRTIEWQNGATEVYFQLAYSQKEAGSIAHGAPHLFDSGLLAQVNFGRPTYFARECFEKLQEFSKKLGLFLFYGQPVSPSEVPEPSTSQLLEEWTRINTLTVNRVRQKEGGRIRFIPKETLDSRWSYLMHAKDFVKLYYPKYFIPAKIFALERTGSVDERCYTCCGWPSFKPEVLPTVDYVAVQRQDHPQFTGLVGLQDIREVLGPSYVLASEPVVHAILEHPPDSQIKSIQNKIVLREEEMKIVQFDQIVDVPP